MKSAVVLSVLVAAAGCARGGAARVGDDDDQTGDAPAGKDAHVTHDGPAGHDAAPQHDAPAAKPKTILMSEIQLGPPGAEFVEVFNPTDAAVTLTDYYLADRNDYYKLPGGTLAAVQSDFIVRFPSGASLAPGGVLTVALGTSASFQSTAGATPTYSITDNTMAKASSVSLVGTNPTLTDSGEIVVLFQWDGTDALVKDVDMMIAGAPTGANGYASKSEVAQGGKTYAIDVGTMPTQSPAPAPGTSTKRILLEAGHEIQNDTGNGLSGDDETSEDTSKTWDSTSFTPATPNTVPASLTN